MKTVLLLVWTITSILTSCCGYPDLSEDYTIKETELDYIYREYVDLQRQMNEDLPDVCKTNLCPKDVVANPPKGIFHWPEILAGQEVDLRCPYSFRTAVYTNRICTVNRQGGAEWNQSNYREVCPDPPLTELLRDLQTQFQYTVTGNATVYLSHMVEEVAEVFTLYRDTPVNSSDINNLMKLIIWTFSGFFHFSSGAKELEATTVQNYLFVLDTLLDDDLRIMFTKVVYKNGFGGSLRRTVTELLFMTDKNSLIQVKLNHIVAETMHISTGEESLHLTDGFYTTQNDGQKKSPSVYLNFGESYKNQSVLIGMIVVQFSDIFLMDTTWLQNIYVEVPVADFIFPNGSVFNRTTVVLEDTIEIPQYLALGDDIHVYVLSDNADALNDIQVSYRTYTGHNNNDTQKSDDAEPHDPIGPSAPSRSSSGSSSGKPGHPSDSSRSGPDGSPSVSPIGPNGRSSRSLSGPEGSVGSAGDLDDGPPSGPSGDSFPSSLPESTTTGSTQNPPTGPPINLPTGLTDPLLGSTTAHVNPPTTEHPNNLGPPSSPPDDDRVDRPFGPAAYGAPGGSAQDSSILKVPVCVKHLLLDVWSSKGCTTTIPVDEDGFTHCVCTGPGAFGVFRELHEVGPTGPPGNEWPSPEPKPTIIEGDISSFLGFPYKRELELLGSVLGSLSLACLIATIVSYSIFSSTRRGSPTTILLHLCVALVVLSVLLLLVQYVDAIQTTTGCTVANALRYYMVFVTLMWNAVEAFNMYLMLVKVFDSKVNHFALKAGIIAWGIPLLMVTICLLINRKSFNGQYVISQNKSGHCTFKCQLSDNMLHYAYLIPLGILILHNLVVFGAVLRTIMKHGQKLGKSKKRSHVVQLVGAVATLVLLGAPWIFSAFGAINATSNDELALLEGVFQVVFVVFVNLQGMFIFAFHCARNAQVRTSWSSAVRSTLSITPSSYMSSRRSKSTESGNLNNESIVSNRAEIITGDHDKELCHASSKDSKPDSVVTECHRRSISKDKEQFDDI